MSVQPVRRTIAGDVPISVLDWGGEGHPVLLLHGLTACAAAWNLVAPLLRPHYRVAAVDQRGHGESGKPDGGYSYAHVADDALRVLDALGMERAAVVGQSWGAGVALWLAAHHPDRVSHVALVDGGYSSRRRSAEMSQQQWESMLAPLEIYRTRETFLEAASADLRDVYSPEIEEILLAAVQLHPDGSVSEKLSREHQVLILRAMWDAPDPLELHARVECPTLLLPARSGHPERAAWNERKEQGVAAALTVLRNGRVHWAENSVHDVHLHRPHEVAQALRELIG